MLASCLHVWLMLLISCGFYVNWILPAITTQQHIHSKVCSHAAAATIEGIEICDEDFGKGEIEVLYASNAMPANRMLWSTRRLGWRDFQGRPDERYPHIAALTASSITYQYYCEEGMLKYEIDAIFRKDESWVRPENRTPYYLQHEQLHFDITELHTRRIRKNLKRYTFRCDQVAAFEKIIEYYLEEWRHQQKRYDKDTNYSNDKYSQNWWYDKIDKDLHIYDNYTYID